MARKIIVTQYASVDGVIEDPVGMEGSGLGAWVEPYHRGPAGDAFKIAELNAADAMIYGRRTYEGFAAVWPEVNDPDGYASRMNSLPKYVASRTLKSATWSNSQLIEGDLVAAATAIKSQPGGDILIFGSGSVVHELLPAGLIDEIRIMTYPVLLGRGIRWFPEGSGVGLQLLETRTFDDGIILTRYATKMEG
jgi:dihydrofolate reductase